MAKHNFKALQTFRGWSKDYSKWFFGYLVHDNDKGDMKIFMLNEPYNRFAVVEKESIGIYTGKDDATIWEDRPDWLKHIPKEDWTGVPIFAGLPEDGNIGRDIVLDGSYKLWGDDSKYEQTISFGNLSDVDYPIQCDGFITSVHSGIKVIGTQYEQHLKETKC